MTSVTIAFAFSWSSSTPGKDNLRISAFTSQIYFCLSHVFKVALKTSQCQRKQFLWEFGVIGGGFFCVGFSFFLVKPCAKLALIMTFMALRFSCAQLATDINGSASLVSVAHLTPFTPLQPNLHWSGLDSADLTTYCTIAVVPLLPTHLSFLSREERSNEGWHTPTSGPDMESGHSQENPHQWGL